MLLQRIHAWLLPFLLLGLLSAHTPAHAERWEISADRDENEVIFESKATMESFEGKTSQIRGWVEFMGEAAHDSVAWWIEVDLASLDTGIGLRNTHMRENHLHTDRYPTAVLEGTRLAAPPSGSLLEAEGMELVLVGDFALHGITREREIPVRARLGPEGAIRVEAAFSVSLEDHEIPLPKFLMLKLADEQRIQVRFLAHPVRTETP